MLDNKYYYQKPQKFFPFSWKKKPQNLISPICPFNQGKNVHSGHKITGWNGGASKIVQFSQQVGQDRAEAFSETFPRRFVASCSLPASRLTLVHHPLLLQDPFPHSFTGSWEETSRREPSSFFSSRWKEKERLGRNTGRVEGGVVYCACPGTNFPTECQIFVLHANNLCGVGGKHLANASVPLWARTWNENFGHKDRVDQSLFRSSPIQACGVEGFPFEGFLHFARLIVDFQVWRILADAKLNNDVRIQMRAVVRASRINIREKKFD